MPRYFGDFTRNIVRIFEKGGKGLNAGGCVTGVQIYADIVTTHGIPNAKLREGGYYYKWNDEFLLQTFIYRNIV